MALQSDASVVYYGFTENYDFIDGLLELLRYQICYDYWNKELRWRALALKR